MFCEDCGANVIEGSQFCGNCGWKVPAAPDRAARQEAPLMEGFCASCGAKLKAGAKFCEHCGAAAGAPSPAAPPAVPERSPSPLESTAARAAPERAPELPPRDGPPPEPAAADNPFDTAVVFRPGHGVASCCLYRDGVLEGTVTDVRGLFMADFTAFIAGRYAGVSIEEQDGGEGRA